MNWANRLTVARLYLTLAFVAVLNSPQWRFSATTALALFLVAGVTDYLDGEVARRFGMQSDFGRLMDPLVDKIMMAAVFICLVELHKIPAWVVIAIISREFLITGLRLLAAAKGKVLPAERLGKHKTAWQIVTAIFFLALLSAPEIAPGLRGESWWVPLNHFGGNALLACALVLTLYSGFGYLWKHRVLIEAR